VPAGVAGSPLAVGAHSPEALRADLRRLRADRVFLRHSRPRARLLAGEPSWQLYRLLILVVLGIVPSTINLGGLSLHALLWMTYAVAGSLLLLVTPLAHRAIPWVALYGAYLLIALASLTYAAQLAFGIQTLVQLSAPALIYVLAWRAPLVPRMMRALPVLAFWGLLIACVLLLMPISGAGVTVAIRPLAIGLAPLFVLATLNSTSPLFGVGTGLLMVAAAVMSGSRSASVMLLLLFVTSPAVRVRWRGRGALIAVTVFLVLLGSQTSSFKQRYFFSSSAGLSEIAGNSALLNTSGRSEFWPQLEATCNRHPIRGFGVGAAYGISNDLSNGTFPQPHNEFIRAYCDTGYAGSFPLWAFYAMLMGRSLWLSVRDASRRRLHIAGAQLLVAVVIMSFTDNPMVYTGVVMAPVLLVLGLSHSAGDRRPRPSPALSPPSTVPVRQRLPVPRRSRSRDTASPAP